jgi:hypothetical protein
MRILSSTRAAFGADSSPKVAQALLLTACLGLVASLGGVLPVSAAPFKVVGPDGHITYTDRPPSGADAKALGARARAADGAASGGPDELASNGVALADLPYNLRPIVQRFPVLLLAGDNCVPCDLGRAALRQRGIPFGERSVKSSADLEALRRQEGGVDLPVLRIGAQRLRGFNGGEWSEYLDLAGYPKASVLTSRFRAPVASPLVSTASGGAGDTPSGTGAGRPPRPSQALPPTVPAAASEDPGKPRIRF